jgi:hypothetical protein
MTEDLGSGGCQCGGVRYMLLKRPNNLCLCHCRMCQKQFGSFFGSFADVDMSHFKLTRGEISFFKSSDEAMRGFCHDCGTPLAYRFASKPRISVSIGSLDRHSAMKPEFQYGLESCEPWLADVLNVPGSITGDGDNGVGDTPEWFEKIRLSCKQHPDHDTEEWPLQTSLTF